jgi:alginate O-acetyltransferase complex protein AlgI
LDAFAVHPVFSHLATRNSFRFADISFMLFNSVTFAVFLIIVFALYWALRNKPVWMQNALLLASGYVFYGWWDWRFLSLLFFTSTTDFIIGISLGKTTMHSRRKMLLITSIVLNIGLLFFFKYYNFFIDSWIQVMHSLGMQANPSTLRIILPVGLSFYTFQSIAYVIDVYRGNITPERNYLSFLAFVSFFPQLVAGPISRAAQLLPQFSVRRRFIYEDAVTGLRHILWGLFKKCVIADRLAYTVDLVYASPGDYFGMAVVLATLFFALQIYCDFSGYSDIALGTARLLGFDLMVNFRTPYFSSSFREFWHRWHISLSRWFRDYVYIPLGGSHVRTSRWVFNLMVTFILSGFWHGANYTFIVWGFLHGIFLTTEALLKRKMSFAWIPRGVKILLVFLSVTFAWIFFRSDSVAGAFRLISSMFENGSGFQPANLFRSHADMLYSFLSIALFAVLEIAFRDERLFTVKKYPPVLRWSFYYLIASWIVMFGEFRFAPTFIYFQF